jgi:hypothetical protein
MYSFFAWLRLGLVRYDKLISSYRSVRRFALSLTSLLQSTFFLSFRHILLFIGKMVKQNGLFYAGVLFTRRHDDPGEP